MKHLIALTLLVLTLSTNLLTQKGSFGNEIEDTLKGIKVDGLKDIAISIEKATEKIIGHDIIDGLKETIKKDLNKEQLIKEIKDYVIRWNKLDLKEFYLIVFDYLYQ